MASSVSPPADSDPYADRRVYPRVTVALPAFLQANGARHSVQIIDLSAGGAKLDCSVAVSVGTAVSLDCGTLIGAATVRWRTDGVIGVAFNRELDGREVVAIIERSRALESLMKTRG